MNMAEGTVDEVYMDADGSERKGLIILVGNRRIMQDTLSEVKVGDKLEVNLDTTQIYRDGADITYTPRPVSFAVILTPL